MDGLGKDCSGVCLFLNKNKKNTLKSFSLKEVDKSLTTKFPACSPPLLLARGVSGAPGATQVSTLQAAVCQRTHCSHFRPNVQMKPHTHKKKKSKEPPLHKEMWGQPG